MEHPGQHPAPASGGAYSSPGWLPWAAPALGSLVALAGAGHLAAWLSGDMAHRGVTTITMKTNTALCLLLLGAALALLVRTGPGPARRRVGLACAGLAWTLGLLTLGENLFGWDLGIDQLLATEPAGALGTVFPNRMGTPAALCFALAGPALVLLYRGGRRELAWTQGLALGLCLIGLLPIMGYLYGAQWLFGVARVTAIAWTTALGVLGLGLGLLLARPGQGLVARMAAPDPGGTLLRRLLPPVVLLPIALGWLRLAGERAGLYDAPMGTALVMLIIIASMSAIAWQAARSATVAAGRLHEQKELLEVTLASIGDAVLACDAQGRVRFLNPAAAALSGWGPGEAMGQPISSVFQIVQEQTGLPGEDIVGRVMAEGRVFELANHTALVTRQGRRVPIEDSAAPIRGADGRIAGVVLVFHDVTEKRRAQEALRESEQRYRDLVDLAPDAILLHKGRRIILANPAAARLLGVEAPDALLGVDILDLVHPDDRLSSQQRIRTAQAGGRSRLSALRVLRRDGRAVHCEATAAGFEFRGRPSVQVFIRDITGRMAAEGERERLMQALQEADRRKNDFLAVLSHELRNPLAPISNSLFLLDRVPPGSAEAAQAREILTRQVAQLSLLVNDLLDITRISRGKIRLQKEHLDLDEAVHRTVEDHRPLFARAGVGLELTPAPGPVPILADRARVVQVLGNLLQNAAKFSRQGGRAVVSVGPEGETAVVRVADDGMGMEPATLETLFQPFMQATQALDRSQGGLGLGLALVKGLVDLHGGSVSASSPGPGKGAELVVRLPLAPGMRPQGPGAGALPPQAGRRILIIEDNFDAADTLRAVLAHFGHQVAVAHDGPRGLALARAFEPEVVLCDIGLPAMDGFEVARAFREDPLLRGAFLVALSGYAQNEDLQRAREAGFQRHLAKLPDLDLLARTLAEAPGRVEAGVRSGPDPAGGPANRGRASEDQVERGAHDQDAGRGDPEEHGDQAPSVAPWSMV